MRYRRVGESKPKAQTHGSPMPDTLHMVVQRGIGSVRAAASIAGAIAMVLAGRSATGHRLAGALAVTLVFAVVARVIHGVTTSGALAGALVSFLLYAAAGPGAFLV